MQNTYISHRNIPTLLNNKKNMRLKEFRKLSKKELLEIKAGHNCLRHADEGGGGGGGAATCTATCLPHNGAEYTVTCSGTACTATDYDGCESENESKACRT